MKSLWITLGLLTALNASAATKPYYQDIKLPTQQMVELQSFGAPIVADTNHVLSAHAGPTSAATVTISTFAAQPDVPRNLAITPGGTTGDVESCVVTVNGTNYFNRSISETFSFAANASTATVGAKAFKTVTSVVFPANCESGGFAATWSIGVGEKLGLKRCMADAGSWLQSSIDGVHESTLATVVADADEIEKNTADFNGTMDGSAVFKGYFFQNFQCLQ